MWSCPTCYSDMDEIIGVTNLNVTGDPKKMYIYRCKDCNESSLRISLKTKTYNEEVNSEFRIDLTDKEKEELIDVMNRCPNPENEDCCCEVHDILDEFQLKNNKKMKMLVCQQVSL